jgi:RHS repeat-associated protein
VDYDPSVTLASDGSINRYYDPATEQFLSVDPLVDETGTPYAFTNGDPVNGSDPSGLDCGGFGGFLASLSPISHCNPSYQQAYKNPVGQCDSDSLLFGTQGGVCAQIPGTTQYAKANPCPASGISVGGAEAFGATTGGNLNWKSAQYFKSKGISPEDLKDEYGYSSDGDLRVQSGSGRIFVGPKNGTEDEMEPTNWRISNGRAIFDPPIFSGDEGGPDFDIIE